MENNLPDLAKSQRPANARRIWYAMREMVDESAPMIPLGRALALNRYYPTPGIAHRLDDAGYLLETHMARTIRALWPGYDQEGLGRRYDPNDRVTQHAHHFGQRMTQYLRGTGNAVCLYRGNVNRASRWWIRAEWFECSPFKFEITSFGSDEPDIPEAEVIRLREENERLRTQNAELSRQLNRMTATLRAVGA